MNTDQLAWKLHEDARVIRIKKNARELTAGGSARSGGAGGGGRVVHFCEESPAGRSACAKSGADLLILVKPQFELEREDVGKGGIVRDAKLHEEAISSVRSAAESLGLTILGVAPSRLAGAEGNQEYFLHARKVAEVESQ